MEAVAPFRHFLGWVKSPERRNAPDTPEPVQGGLRGGTARGRTQHISAGQPIPTPAGTDGGLAAAPEMVLRTARRAHTNGGFDPSLLTRRRAARRTISGAGSPPPSVPAGVGTGRPAEMCWVLPRAVPPRRPPTGRAPACRAHHPVRDSSTRDPVPSPGGAPTSSTPLDFWCHKCVRRRGTIASAGWTRWLRRLIAMQH